MAVVPVSPFLCTEDNSVVLSSYNINNRLRSQQFDVESGCFRETDSIYITGRKSLLRTSNRISCQVGLFKMEEVKEIDIDTELDFQIAATLNNNLRDFGDSTFQVETDQVKVPSVADFHSKSSE